MGFWRSNHLPLRAISVLPWVVHEQSPFLHLQSIFARFCVLLKTLWLTFFLSSRHVNMQWCSFRSKHFLIKEQFWSEFQILEGFKNAPTYGMIIGYLLLYVQKTSAPTGSSIPLIIFCSNPCPGWRLHETQFGSSRIHWYLFSPVFLSLTILQTVLSFCPFERSGK